MVRKNPLVGWLGMVPRRLWMAVLVLVLLAAFALAFSRSTVVQAGMAPGGSRVTIIFSLTVWLVVVAKLTCPHDPNYIPGGNISW